MENNSRKINLEITGIPAVTDENCKQIIEDEHLKNIDVAHRLLTHSTDKIAVIIVKYLLSL